MKTYQEFITEAVDHSTPERFEEGKHGKLVGVKAVSGLDQDDVKQLMSNGYKFWDKNGGTIRLAKNQAKIVAVSVSSNSAKQYKEDFADFNIKTSK